ncbi:MAG: hypothetical protein M1831_001455 [Alyxoria varia]|nr:MAG: hypothetical protein M1831_001455 [Alyxoria varia]
MSEADAEGSLFRDIRFFLVQRLPDRSTFKNIVERNGGQVVPLERNADIMIADHLRKDAPPESYSYTWIEKSVSEGRLVDKEQHRAGRPKAVARSVGSLEPAQGKRVPYSKQDDDFLYDWVTEYEKNGGKVKGNEIYKQLEKENPAHPWQSWRDRWVKYISRRPRPASPPQPLEQTQTTTAEERVPEQDGQIQEQNEDQSEHQEDQNPAAQIARESAQTSTAKLQISRSQGSDQIPKKNITQSEEPAQPANKPEPRSTEPVQPASQPTHMSRDRRKGKQPFTEEERDYLFIEGRRILGMIRHHGDEGWSHFALVQPTHTAEEWKEFFESEVRPKIEKVNRLSGVRDELFQELENASQGLQSQSQAGSSGVISPKNLKRKRPASQEFNMPEDARNKKRIAVSPPINHRRKSNEKDATRASSRPEAASAVNSNTQQFDSVNLVDERRQEFSQEDRESNVVNAETNGLSQGEDIQIYEDEGWIIEDDKENDIDKRHNLAQPRAKNSEETLEAFSTDNPIAFNLVSAHSEYRDIDDEAPDYDEDFDTGDSDVEESDRRNDFQQGPPSSLERTPVKKVAVGPGREIYSDDWTGAESPSAQIRAEQSSRPIKRGRNRQDRPERALFVASHSEDESDEFEDESPKEWEGVSHQSGSANGANGQHSQHDSLPRDETQNPSARSQSVEVDVSMALPPKDDNDDDVQPSQINARTGQPSPNPRRAATNTQAIIDGETQDPDLSMPLPPTDDQDPDVYDVPSSPPNGPTSPLPQLLTPRRHTLPQRPSPRASLAAAKKASASPNPTPSHSTTAAQNIFPTHSRYQYRQSIDSQPSAASPHLSTATANSTADVHDIEAFQNHHLKRGHTKTDVATALMRTTCNARLAEQVLKGMKMGRAIPKDMRGVWTREDDEALSGGNAVLLKKLEAKHGDEACEKRREFLEDS